MSSLSSSHAWQGESSIVDNWDGCAGLSYLCQNQLNNKELLSKMVLNSNELQLRIMNIILCDLYFRLNVTIFRANKEKSRG